MPPSRAPNPTVPAPLRPSGGGYRKGEETRRRILAIALRAFGNHGFAAVTTRQIAEAAGINLPALTYYFGNKEGLYLACAHDIASSFRLGVGDIAETAAAALGEPISADEARELLKRLSASLAQFLLSADGAQDRALFVQQEMASPGPAFEILYAELWRPGIELAAALIARTTAGRLSGADSKVRAVLMIASLTGFSSGQRIIARTAGEGAHLEQVIAAIHEQIDALAPR